MNLSIKKETDYRKVVGILQKFKNTLYSLKSGIVNIEELAKKAVKNGEVLVAVCEDEIVGFCIFYANDQTTYIGYISMISVDHNKRNMHIGTTLLNHIYIVCRQRGMKTLKLSVRNKNIGAVRFYERNGFTFFAHNGDESVFLTKIL